MKRFRFGPEALGEFEEAVDHYLEISPDIAAGFVDAFEEAVAFVQSQPEATPRIEGDLRRWNLRRFPYAIIFRVVDEIVVVVAVMHQRREPEYWRRRAIAGPSKPR